MGQQGALHGPVPDEVQGLARQEVQPVAVRLVRRDCQLSVGGTQAHHGLKHQALALLDVLAHGVEVRGELHAGGEEALALLALALAEELLPPLRHEPERRVIAGQELNGPARPVQLVPDGGVPPGRAPEGSLGAGLHHLRRSLHQGGDIHPGHGNGQQAHGGQHAVSAAHVVGDHEGLPSLAVRQGLQGATGLVRGGVDPLPGALPAVLLLQGLPEEAEGHGGLSSGARLGNHVDGEIHIRHQVQHLPHSVGGKAVAHKVDVGGILALQVVIGRAQAVDDTPGA